jgi:hypothetical protein
MTITRLMTLALALVPCVSLAQPRLGEVCEQLDRVAMRARRAGGECRQQLFERIATVADGLDAQRAGRPRGLGRVIDELSDTHAEAANRGCPDDVLDGLLTTMDQLSEVRLGLQKDRKPDDESGAAQLGALTLTVTEGEVRVSLSQLTLRGLKGQAFLLGARFRAANGTWSQLEKTPRWSVPADPFVWKDAFMHPFPLAALAAADTAGGRFVARVSVFDGQQRELGSREVRFTLPGAAAAGSVRDCGTGVDVGCSQARGGVFPLERAGFVEVMNALLAEKNEKKRVKVAEARLATASLTAAQLGLVLDQFPAEKVRLEVAKRFLARVVNPADAAVLSTRFTQPDARAAFSQAVQAQVNPNATPRGFHVEGDMEWRTFSLEAPTRAELNARCRAWKDQDIKTQGGVTRLNVGGRVRDELLNSEQACNAVAEAATPLY